MNPDIFFGSIFLKTLIIFSFILFVVFSINSQEYLTRDLLNTELGLDYLSRSGDMQISRLRLKLKKECNLTDIIRSVHGKGYKIFI